MFDYAVKRELVVGNPASVFDPPDAGGKEEARQRWLNQSELAQLFDAMRSAKGWTYENSLVVKMGASISSDLRFPSIKTNLLYKRPSKGRNDL